MTALLPTPATPLLELELPFPPSLNTYWRHVPQVIGGRARVRVLISEQGRIYRDAVGLLLCTRRLAPIRERVAVEIDAYPPDRRIRDLDNLPKSLLDALTHAGVWTDDCQIDRLTIARESVSPGGKVCVRVYRAIPGG